MQSSLIQNLVYRLSQSVQGCENTIETCNYYKMPPNVACTNWDFIQCHPWEDVAPINSASRATSMCCAWKIQIRNSEKRKLWKTKREEPNLTLIR